MNKAGPMGCAFSFGFKPTGFRQARGCDASVQGFSFQGAAREWIELRLMAGAVRKGFKVEAVGTGE
jgi:hypothetical protein